MTKSTGKYRRGARPIKLTLTPHAERTLAALVADMQAKGEMYAHQSGAVEAALLAEAARRGIPLPVEAQEEPKRAAER